MVWAEAQKGVSWERPPGAVPPPVWARASWEAQQWPRGEKEEQRGKAPRSWGGMCGLGWNSCGTVAPVWGWGGGLGEGWVGGQTEGASFPFSKPRG